MTALGGADADNPSPALIPRAPSPQGSPSRRLRRIEKHVSREKAALKIKTLAATHRREGSNQQEKTALSLGERVDRCRRLHQPERAG